MAHLYKSRLQTYAQKKGIAFPIYACEMDGPPHARLFKGKVTINGSTYESPDFCSTLKEAEQAAAKVAFLSLSPDDFQEDDGLYKSLLQELAQKKCVMFPVYTTVRVGPSHLPTFTSTVEVANQSFQGQEARTKKQAEMNAAKIAYAAFTEDQGKENHTAISYRDGNMGALNGSSSGSLSVAALEANDLQGEVIQNAEMQLGSDVNVEQNRRSLASDELQVCYPTNALEDSGATGPACYRVVVRPYKPNMIYEGPVVVSDDKWVAMKVRINNE